MKAAIYSANGTPDVFRVVELPDPVAGPGEVLVAIEAISIEGGDLLGRRTVAPANPPRVKGYAAAGRVVGLGEGVTRHALGDRVTTFAFEGSHASLRVVPADQCWIMADNLSMEVAAAALITFGTAALALDLAGTQRGDTVLVTGAAGGVGIATIQLAAQLGARVIGTGSSAESLAGLARFGLNDGVVIGETPLDEQVRARLGGQGVDSVIDNIGGQSVKDGLAALDDGGRLVLVGLFDGDVHRISPVTLLLRRLTVAGCFLGPIIAQPRISAMIDDVLARLASGGLEQPIDSRFTLDDVVAAHTRAEGRGRIGRVVMTV